MEKTIRDLCRNLKDEDEANNGLVHAISNSDEHRVWCGIPWRKGVRAVGTWAETTCPKCLKHKSLK